MLNKTPPWLPCKPTPQYVRRVSFFTAIKNRLAEKFDVLREKLRWKYYGIVYQTKNPYDIRRALATEAATKLYNMRAPVRAVQVKLIADVMMELPTEIRQTLNCGTIEYNGWRELPDSVDMVLFLSWTPAVGPRLYRICAPSMAVLVRNRDTNGENEYEPKFADLIYKIPQELRFNRRNLTPEAEQMVLGRTLIALANAIQVEEQLRADAN